MTELVLPLSERIRRTIEARIMSGAWEAGRRIPPEHALMAEYDCSRMTVSKALTSLVERGLIERRKRAGSFVAAPRMHRGVIDFLDVTAEIENLGQAHRLDILERRERTATEGDREVLELGGSENPVLALSCLHRAGPDPFALEDRLINLAAVSAARHVDFAKESPGKWLLGHVPWTDASHRILAIAADDRTARLLDVPLSAPCLAVERWTWRSAERITHVRLVYAGHHALTARFLA